MLAHGVLLALSLPPTGFWPLAFVSLLPVLAGARCIGKLNLKWKLLAGTGLLPFWLFTHLWTADVTSAGFLPLCIIVAAISHLAVLLISLADRHQVAAGVSLAVFWTGADYVRGTIAFDGYAWGFVSHPLIEWWPAASPAIGSSIYVATFMLAFLQGAVFECVRLRTKTNVVAVLSCLSLWIACWFIADREVPQGRVLRVAAIQTNVPQSNKLGWDLDRQLEDWREMRSLATEAVQARPDLVIWPETMIPGITLSPEANIALSERQIVYRTQDGRAVAADFFASDLLRLQREADIPMLVGDEGVDELKINESGDAISLDFGKRYNSVFMVERGAVAARYDKVHLTPFGEVMPYIRSWPWLQRQLLSIGASGMSFTLSEGTSLEPFVISTNRISPPVRVVTPICFESTDHALLHSLVFRDDTRRADLLAFVTNDGWFGAYDMIRSQHLQAARWRCLETATPGVRAANTGVSAIIDCRGRIIASGVANRPEAHRVAGVLTGACELPGSQETPGRVHPAFLLLLLAFFRRSGPR